MRRLSAFGQAAVVIGLLSLAACSQQPDDAPRVGSTTPLHEAAKGGHLSSVEELLASSNDVNAPDEHGLTPLHWAARNGHLGTTGALLDAGADANAVDVADKTALEYAVGNDHGQTADRIRQAGGTAGASKNSDRAATAVRGINPSAPFADLTSFERGIGGRGVLLTSENVWFFGPESREDAMSIVFPYLVRAYDELYRIAGQHTDYIMVVYAFPQGHRDAFGGTSNCVIFYDDHNLDLNQHSEWTRHRQPHVSGYTEEMAHNFVHAARAQFGWEAMGWSLGVKAAESIAGNPYLHQQVEETRRTQAETFRRYRAAGNVFPLDIAPNLVDRLHAHLLWQCEQDYGPNFWKDAFTEIRKVRDELISARGGGGDDALRNVRYAITVNAIDRLPGLGFKHRLQEAGISRTVSVKSLHPTEPGWNRRLE